MKKTAAVFVMLCFVSHAAMAGMFKDFGYDKAEQSVDAGSIGAALAGTHSSDEGDSLRGRPYSLEVTMALNAKQMETGCSVLLKSLSMTNAKTGEEVFYTTEKLGTFKRKLIGASSGRYVATFAFDDIGVPYEDYKLAVAFALKGCPSKAAGEQEEKVSLAFKKHYTEKEMSVFESLMGK